MQNRPGKHGTWAIAVGTIVALIGASGCRDNAPEPPMPRDLGADGRILLPTAYAWHNDEILAGSADWHPFREPNLDAPIAAPAEAPTVADAPEMGEVERRIRDMIADYNAISLEEEPEVFLDFFVEDQREALAPTLRRAIDLTTRMQNICNRLRERLPDAAERVNRVCAALMGKSPVALEVVSVEPVSDQEARLELQAGAAPFQAAATLIDEYWYMALNDPAAYGVPEAPFQAARDALQALADALASGAAPAEQVLNGLEQAAAVMGAGGATEPADDAP